MSPREIRLMKWEGRAGSDNIEDRRGMGGRQLAVGGGLGGLILLLLVSALTGRNPADLIDTGEPPTDGGQYQAADPNDPQYKFVSVVLKDTEDTWGELFAQAGRTYERPALVLFNDATQSACGVGQSEMGPFYCPADRKVYLDLSFFRELDERFAAPGDFARAYVVAHEVGHHIQMLTGISQRLQTARERSGEREGNALSVRQELQADCYAGVFGYYEAKRGVLDPGDAEEGLRAAAAIGDDTLQRQTQGRIVPESFTHGSSAQRVAWFKRGLESGRVDACNTFTDGGVP
ncbi:MAG TPA: neutral zinc metallopeptidase [Vicinamibacterales bacterium]